MLNPKGLKKKNKTVKTPDGEKVEGNLLNGFQIISLSDFQSNPKIPRHVFETAHQLPFDLIWICTEGEGEHFVDFETYHYKKGSIFFIKKGQYHKWNLNPSNEGFLLFFTDDFYIDFGTEVESLVLGKTAEKLSNPLLQIDQPNSFESIKNLLALVLNEHLLLREHDNYLKSLINALITKLEIEYINVFKGYSKFRSKQIFSDFQSLLDDKIGESRNGNYYCDALGVNFEDLNRLCKEHSGFTLKVFIDKVLLAKSKKMLIIRNSNITEIAFHVGFNEVGNFSKYFKRHTGMTPRQFRDQN